MVEATLENVMSLMVKFLVPVKDGRLHRNSCILSTAVAQQILRHYGFKAQPQPVRFTAGNWQFHLFMDAGEPERAKAQEKGAYAVGAGFRGMNEDAQSWDGHLVLLVEDKYLFDFNVEQAQRPEKGLMPTSFFANLNADWSEHGRLTTALDGQWVVAYEATEDMQWRAAPDWRDKKRGRNMADEFIKVIDKLLSLDDPFNVEVTFDAA